MRTRLLAVCLLPLLLGTAAACGESNDGRGVASVDGSAAASVTPSLSRLDLLTRLSQCMREHGVPMADPEVEGDTVRQGRYEKGAVSEDTEIKAEEACKQYRPPQERGPGMDLKKELARRFARCMREHGVEKFPDPDPDGPTRVSSEVGADPRYPQARQACDAQTDAAFRSMRPSPS
ncbi:hypothetical protein ABZ860_33875 [Microbispora sp. NPDC046973]|uniref:hypothetical protein n=1 Tax=Microbispora sp. NPDC046973 TaxID=3155022 RepID=UPI00340AB4F6